MTPTPRTDAEWQSITASAPWDAAADQMANHARQLERELTQWQTELSKVMPPDFKDWWQNSKAEWPLIARLVIEGKNRERASADEYTARIEREITGWREMIELEVSTLREELVDADKDYRCLAELLDGNDATECRANLVRLKADLAAEREQVAILRSDEKRLVGFAKTYRARADDLDDTLAAERGLADRLADALKISDALFHAMPRNIPTQAHRRSAVKMSTDQHPIDYVRSSLAAWKEARHE